MQKRKAGKAYMRKFALLLPWLNVTLGWAIFSVGDYETINFSEYSRIWADLADRL